MALGRHGQGAGRQQTLNDLALLKFDFLKGFWLENGIFSGEQDGKRKINPIPASHIGSVFSSVSVNLSKDLEIQRFPGFFPSKKFNPF